MGGDAQALAYDADSGRLYAGGRFTAAGGAPAAGVAVLNAAGSAWTDLPGLRSRCNAPPHTAPLPLRSLPFTLPSSLSSRRCVRVPIAAADDGRDDDDDAAAGIAAIYPISAAICFSKVGDAFLQA